MNERREGDHHGGHKRVTVIEADECNRGCSNWNGNSIGTQTAFSQRRLKEGRNDVRRIDDDAIRGQERKNKQSLPKKYYVS